MAQDIAASPYSVTQPRRRYILYGGCWFLFGLAIIFASLTFRHQGQPLHMVRLSRGFYERPGVSAVVGPIDSSFLGQDGFDGQFFFYLGFDPMLRGDVIWRSLDSPHLRARRIGLSWAAWLLGLRGQIAVGLLLTQCLALGLIITIVQSGAWHYKRSPFVALTVVCSISTLVPIELMTCEVLAGALTLASLLAWRRGKLDFAWLLAAGACLTKEICGLLVLALVYESLRHKRWKEAAGWLAALLPLGAWVIYLLFRLPFAPGADGSLENFTWPLMGALHAIRTDLSYFISGIAPFKNIILVLCIGWFLAGAFIAIGLLARGYSAIRLFAAGAAWVALTLSSGAATPAYDAIPNFSRQLFLLPIGLYAEYFFTPDESHGRRARVLLWWMLMGAGLGILWAMKKLLLGETP